jgi:outer membrane cobalamin receptor
LLELLPLRTKPPTLSQLFVDFPAFGFFGNPNLKPEESTGHDIGFEQPVMSDVIRFRASLPQYWVDRRWPRSVSK